MEEYRTDEERAEALKEWWSENGTSVVGGIIIGLAAVFGWRGWQDYQITQAEAASDLYQKIVVDIRNEKDDEAKTLALQLIDEYPSTTYAVFAHLIMAKLFVEKNDYSAATEHLQWVIDNASENEFQLLARLRLARILLAEDKPEQSIELLDAVDPGEFLASYEELKGDSYIKQGKTEDARNAYNNALSNQKISGRDNSILEMKLGNLGQLNQ